MWMSTEDARSDFILAAAAMIFGSLVARFVLELPFYPGGGVVGRALLPVWVVVLTVLPARFLARYRDQGLEGFGLGPDRSGLTEGLLVALPLLVVGYVRGFSSGNVLGALLGRFRGVIGGPQIQSLSPLDLLFNGVLVATLIAGGIALYGLLVTRARDGFRPTELPLVQALRTFGLGAAGASLVLGLLLWIAGQRSMLAVLLDAGALALMVLVADRLVASGDRTTRATILSPAIVALTAHLIASGGLFSAGLANGLYAGATSGGLAIVAAVLLETRRGAWAVVPLVVASAWAPTCLTLPVGLLVAFGQPGC